MKRSRIAVLVGCLLVAGSAGAGTANANQPVRTTERPPAVDTSPDPLPDLQRRLRDDPPRGRALPIPQVRPMGPGPVPIPLMKPRRPGPVPMPQLDRSPDALEVPRPGRMPRPERGMLPPPLGSTIEVR